MYGWLGVVVGVVMPVLSAILYPVYMHQMQPSWAEWTRLMELPFVACELLIIHVALRRGLDDLALARSLPMDIRIALMLLGIGLIVGSAVASQNPAASITLSIITLIHLRFSAAIYFLARRDGPAQIRLWFVLLGAGLAALTVLTTWKFSFPPPSEAVPGGIVELRSAVPGFIDVRHFGSWTGAVAAGLMIMLLYDDDQRFGLFHLMYLLAAGLTCWSGTRAAVLAMVVVAVIAVIGLRRLPGTRAMVMVGLLSVLSLGVGMALAPAGLPEFGLFGRTDFSNANALTTGRDVLWSRAYLRWLDAPLFGWGSGSTFWELRFSWTPTQPHNVVLQFLISWGLVGALGGLWLLVRAIAATFRPGFDRSELRPLTAMLYCLLAMSLVEGMLYYPRFIMAVMIGFAVILASKADPIVPDQDETLLTSLFSRSSNTRFRSGP